MPRIWISLCLLLLGALPLQAAAAAPSCEDPQSAARSLLDWQQPDNNDPAAAATCLDLPASRASEGPALAIKLKQVLDARGLYVPTQDLPSDPDYVDSVEVAVVVPMPQFSEFRLEKKGDQWLIARSTVESIPRLHSATFSGLTGTVKQHLPPELRDARFMSLAGWQWVYAVLLLLLALLAGGLTQAVIAGQIGRVAEKAGIRLDGRIVSGTRIPLTYLAISGVALWGIPDLLLGVRANQALLFVARTAMSLAAVLVLVRFVNIAGDYFNRRARATESKLDDQVIPLAVRSVKVLVWALGIMFIIQNMGFEIASLLAGVSIGGVAVALAAKDTVENLFGSVLIFLDRPFQIGDWVVVDGDVEGVVEEVGFRSTRVRTFYNSVVTVPNAKVANARVDNMGMRRFRRVKTTLGLTYDTTGDQMDAYVAALKELLETDDAVADSTREVYFGAFSASSLDVTLYFFLDVPDWSAELRERQRLFLTFMRLAEGHGVSFAYPTQTVHLANFDATPNP